MMLIEIILMSLAILFLIIQTFGIEGVSEAGGFLKMRAIFRIPFAVFITQVQLNFHVKKHQKKDIPHGFSQYKDKILKILEDAITKIEDGSTADLLWSVHVLKKDFAPTSSQSEVLRHKRQSKVSGGGHHQNLGVGKQISPAPMLAASSASAAHPKQTKIGQSGYF
jgi:hypothetical protein